MTLEADIGRRIGERRQLLGLTQSALGDLVGDLPRQAVWSAERGQRAFPVTELVAFAAALNCTVAELIGETEPLPSPDLAGIHRHASLSEVRRMRSWLAGREHDLTSRNTGREEREGKP